MADTEESEFVWSLEKLRHNSYSKRMRERYVCMRVYQNEEINIWTNNGDRTIESDNDVYISAIRQILVMLFDRKVLYIYNYMYITSYNLYSITLKVGVCFIEANDSLIIIQK